MYKRILLAYDGSVEGRTALREGALLAKACHAQVHLLSVIADTPGLRLAEGAFAGAVSHQQDHFREILEDGAAKLRELGFEPTTELAMGEPAQVIGAVSRKMDADLVVVGHQRQSRLARWWAGPASAYLVDYVDCSVLIARTAISDERFAASAAPQTAPA